jgi:hypothetical protein
MNINVSNVIHDYVSFMSESSTIYLIKKIIFMKYIIDQPIYYLLIVIIPIIFYYVVISRYS